MLKPTARDVADKLPEAAGHLNNKVKANAEEVVYQLQGQVRLIHPSFLEACALKAFAPHATDAF